MLLVYAKIYKYFQCNPIVNRSVVRATSYTARMVPRLRRVCPLVHAGRRNWKSLEVRVVEHLRRREQTLSVAESCTGGLLANRITDVKGCSAVFLEGLVLYSNAAKSKRLCLPESIIQSYGVVSETIAIQMAERLLHISGAHHALSTTGVAGPTGGTRHTPVGTVFIGLASQQGPTQVRREFFPKSRASFKQCAVDAALNMLLCRVLLATATSSDSKKFASED